MIHGILKILRDMISEVVAISGETVYLGELP